MKALMLLVLAVSIAQAAEPPTATEVCAELGEKIMEENDIGMALSQVSRYDPRINRCYVELIVVAADVTKSKGVSSIDTCMTDKPRNCLRLLQEITTGPWVDKFLIGNTGQPVSPIMVMTIRTSTSIK